MKVHRWYLYLRSCIQHLSSTAALQNNLRLHLWPVQCFYGFVHTRRDVNFLRSLNWRWEIRLGMSDLYSSSMLKRQHSLSILNCSAVRLNAITSRSEKRGTTPLLGVFPCSFTRFLENFLQTSRIFPYFEKRLRMTKIN